MEGGTGVSIEAKTMTGVALGPPGARQRSPKKVPARRREAPWIPYLFLSPALTFGEPTRTIDTEHGASNIWSNTQISAVQNQLTQH